MRRRENEIVEEMMRELGMEEDKTLTGESVKTNKVREPKQDGSFPLPTDCGRYSLYEVIQSYYMHYYINYSTFFHSAIIKRG